MKKSRDAVPATEPLEFESVVEAALKNASLPSVVVRAALVEILDDWSRRESLGEPVAVRRMNTNYVSQSEGNLIDLSDFERSLYSELDQIVWICQRPLQDLRYEELVQPVGRIRRLARGAALQLTSHSEQWERWAPDFPIPKEVLGMLRDDEVDLYENRVVRTLVTGARAHISRRLSELQSHLNKNNQGQLVLSSGWFWKQRRVGTAFNDHEFEQVIALLNSAIKDLKAMLSRLAAMEGTPLFGSTSSRSPIRWLRITNVLRRDLRYSRIPPLWRLWSSARDQETETLKRLENDSLIARSMSVLTEILVARALDWLGFSFDELSGSYCKEQASVTLSVNGLTLVVSINDLAGNRDVRFVSIGKSLYRPDAADPIAMARELDTALNSANQMQSATALVHPIEEMPNLTMTRNDIDLLDHCGIDSVDDERIWAVIPASPLSIDSLERVARFLRWHLYAPILNMYPPQLTNRRLSKSELEKIQSLESIHIRDNAICITHPLSSATAEVVRLIAKDQPSDWLSSFSRADALFATVKQCPVYPSHSSRDVKFSARDNDTFVCLCENCRTEWGVNLCGLCRSKIPFLRPYSQVPENETPKQFFGCDILTTLCEGSIAQATEIAADQIADQVPICQSCRRCSKSDKFRNCPRCRADED